MLEVKVLASGSDGNCTLIKTSAGENILCDVGVSLKKVNKPMKFAPIDYAIVTHEHKDHAYLPAIKTLLANGTEVYMTAGTQKALELDDRHNLHIFKAQLDMTPINVGSCRLKALMSQHDAAEGIVFKIYDADDSILYSTDTKRPPLFNDGGAFTKMIMEANFSESVLAESAIDDFQKKRIANNHTSMERLVSHFEHLQKYKHTKFDELYRLKEIHLIHISKRHGDGSDFKAALEKVIDVPIFTH